MAHRALEPTRTFSHAGSELRFEDGSIQVMSQPHTASPGSPSGLEQPLQTEMSETCSTLPGTLISMGDDETEVAGSVGRSNQLRARHTEDDGSQESARMLK